MYSLEDVYDQGICQLAKEKNYDTVILLRMFGKNRIVSEVLDVRDRKDSFKNIVRAI